VEDKLVGNETKGKTFVEKHGKLSVNQTFLVNESGEKVLLKGVSFGWHNWWPRFYNANVVKHWQMIGSVRWYVPPWAWTRTGDTSAIRNFQPNV
jgi:endoglucanase